MSQSSVDQVDQLLNEVTASAKYRLITPDLVRWIGARELSRHKNFKEAVKATRNRLHLVGASYQEGGIQYDRIITRLHQAAMHIEKANVTDQKARLVRFQPTLRSILESHASTSERLPILDEFYTSIFAPIAPIQSILDLACGLNPLTAAWMPLNENATYVAIDIYQDMVHFLNQVFSILHIHGRAEQMNLLEQIPDQHYQVALLLKALPCLEQLDKNASLRLMDGIQADYLLVSYPVYSLSGRSKGMRSNYEERFQELTKGRLWKVERFEFATELVFLVTK